MAQRFWIVCSFVCIIGLAEAKPHGFHLKSGEAQNLVQDSAGKWIIRSGKKAHIDWDSFNIDIQEALHFQQDDTLSYVLNRVVGGTPSAILGQLSSNGAVYLVNPSGILIGKEAHIQTAGFIASTLDLIETSNNILRFQGDSQQGVINYGTIHCSAGDIFLIGRTAQNHGTLSSPEGRQGLLSGTDIVIRPEGAPEVWIQPETTVDEKVLEENPYAYAIRHTGASEAKEVYLVASEGRTEASGEIKAESGTIHLLGDHVHLLDTAIIDASGKTGGGTVLVGGDYQGSNPAIKNAKLTWAEKGSVIKADALEEGSGGRVILWSDKATLHFGTISARGGEKGGDGGFVEISGPRLQWGITDLRAPQGKAGELLLDPNDVEIGNTATTGSFSSCSYQFVAGTATNQILNTDLQTQLGMCSTVTISTVGTSGSGPNGGSILISQPVTWSNNSTLTLVAASYIDVEAAVTNTSATTGFTAIDFTGLGGSGAHANPGVLLANSGTLTANGGNISLSGTSSSNATSSYGVYVNGSINPTIQTTTGNITLIGTVPSGATGTLNGVQVSSNITSASGTLLITGTTNGTATNSSGVFITDSAQISTNAPITINGTGSSSVAGASNFTWGVVIGTAGGASGSLANISTGTNGSVSITGLVPGGSSSGTGVTINNGISSPITGSGPGCMAPITISGISHAAGNFGNGVVIFSNTSVPWITSTGGALTFVNCQGSTASTVATTHGLIIESNLVTGGAVIATTGIVGGTGTTSHGFTLLPGTVATNIATNQSGFSGGDIQITASTLATGATACRGISLTTNMPGQGMQVNNGHNITLIGTASAANTGASRGVQMTSAGTYSTDTGTISIAGQVPDGATGSVRGVSIDQGTITTSGSVKISGVVSATNAGSGSYGVQIGGTGTAAITGAITFGSSITDGTVTITGCQGGSGTSATASHGINFGSAFTGSGDMTFQSCVGGNNSTTGGNGINISVAVATSGNITATSTISGSGNGGTGFASSANFATSGAGKAIAITASSSGTTGNCHGIALTAGTLQTSSASGGTITLNGSGGSSTSTSHGISISSTGLVTTSANNSTIALTGTGGTGSGGGNGINLAGSANSVTSGASGNITLTGTGSTNNTTTSHGVAVVTNTWTPNNGGTLTFSSCTGGSGTGGNGVDFQTVFTGNGNVAFTNCIRGSSSGFGLNINANFSTTGSFTLTSSTPSTSGFSANSSLATLTASSFSIGSSVPTTLQRVGTLTIDTSGSNGPISFVGTINGTSANVSALTTTAGVGATTFSGNIGNSFAIGALNATGGIMTFNGTVAASSAAIINSGLLTIAGDFTLNPGTFAQTGVGLVDLGADITTSAAAISFLRGVTLVGDATLNTGGTTAGGQITFSNTLDGMFDLASTGSTVDFEATVGGITPLSSLDVTADTIVIKADQTVSDGPMSYHGLITLQNSVQLTNDGSSGTNFHSGSLGNTAISGGYNLTLRVPQSSITVTGDIDLGGGSGASGGGLSATCLSGFTLSGELLTTGGDNGAGSGGSGGNVSITASADSISVNNINTSGGSGTTTGGNAGNITLQPSSGYSGGYPVGVIVLKADLSAGQDGNLVALGGAGGITSGNNGDITLSANRSSAATVATITSSLAGNNIFISGNSCTMGSFEAMTGFGSITFVCPTLTLGDLVALDNIIILANTVNLNTHGSISLLNNLGGFYVSPSLHFLGGTSYFASGTFVPAGASLNAQNLGLSPLVFEPLLKFNSHILNYDTTYAPNPPPSPSSGGGQAPPSIAQVENAFYQLLIADAELSDLLPLYRHDLPPPFQFKQRESAYAFKR
jgi:filamentous hemagglutinin family protein